MDADLSNLEKLLEKISDGAMNIGLRLVLAIVVYLVGSFIIKKLLKGMGKMKTMKSIDKTAGDYIMTAVRAALYVILLVSIIALMGVPMSSVIAVIASAGVAIGMALQGSLSNIAGGIMLLIFRPFSVGDYISNGSEEGTVRSISLVYTMINTIDNRRVCIPNGNLMNSSITNVTAEPLRRIDLNFDIAGTEDPEKIEKLMGDVIAMTEGTLTDPLPRVMITASVPGGLTYTVRVWVKTAEYWDVYGRLMKHIPAELNAEGIARPATPVSVKNN